MTEPTELRFRSPGWKFYGQGLAWSALTVAVSAWGWIGVALVPGDWIGILSKLGGVILGLSGTVMTLFIWGISIGGTIWTWHRWRQLRPPAVVIDDSGIRYLARRRPVFVPWPDVERLVLHRTIRRRRVISSVALYLIPDAALLRDGPIAIPPRRSLNVSTFETLTVPEDVAVRFLEETAGSRLEVEVDDRRDPADDLSSY